MKQPPETPQTKRPDQATATVVFLYVVGSRQTVEKAIVEVMGALTRQIEATEAERP